MKRAFTCIVMLLSIVSVAWGQSEFQTQTERIFSSSIIESVKMSGGKGLIIFKDPPDMKSYFRTGDKINKIFAIESARLFRDVNDLADLKMVIPLSERNYVMSITRKQINNFYGLDFASIKGDLDTWRAKFIQKYDNKKSRAYFAQNYVTSK